MGRRRGLPCKNLTVPRGMPSDRTYADVLRGGFHVSEPLMPWVLRKHGTHDQKSHGRKGSGTAAMPTARTQSEAKQDRVRTKSYEDAVRALAEGKIVELETADEVYTLIEKLYEFAQEARAKGEKAPNIDLCSVSVPGTNLFCGGNLGIERSAMPQLSGKPRPGSAADSLPKDDKGEVNIGKAFTDRLGELGVEVQDRTIPAASLRASQKQLVGANVAWMMKNGDKIGLDTGRIFVSKDGYVIDGHHRWAALVGQDTRDGKLGDVSINVQQIDMPIAQVLQFANAFADEVGVMPKAAKRRVPLGVRAYMTW